MPNPPASRRVASCLVAALVAPVIPAWAGAPPARAALTGTVVAGDGTQPFEGATQLLTDASGRSAASAPTKADGAFKIENVAPGRDPVATPVTLAPGQTRGVQVALKGRKKKGGAVAAASRGTGVGAMIAVIVGFVAAGAIAADKANNDNKPASPSTPAD